jgi:hypothetical protein
MLRWTLLFLALVSGPVHSCDLYARLAKSPLATSKFDKEGFEPIEAQEPTADETSAIFAALTAKEKHGVAGARVEKGRVIVLHPLKQDPVHGPALERLEAYLNDLYAASREKLRAMPKAPSFEGARIEIRFSKAGEYHPTAYDRGHVDGGYATTIVSLIGPGTIVLPENDVQAPVPVGVPALITGKLGRDLWKTPGTWHRAPPLDHKPDRLFIQFVF